MFEQTAAVTMAQETCFACSMVFWVPQAFQERRRQDHQTFYCPAGHGQIYPAEKLRERLARAEHCCEQQRAKAEELNRSNIALRGVVTRQKRKTRKMIPAQAGPSNV
jgi:hypothetical protein